MAASLDAIEKMLRRHLREVATLREGQAEEFASYIETVRRDLVGRLSKLSAQSLDAFRLRQVLAETEDQIKILRLQMERTHASAVSEAVELAARQTSEGIMKMSKAFGSEPMTIELSAQNAMADPEQGLLADHFASSVETYGSQLLNEVRRDVFVSLRTGDTLQQTADRITGRMGAFGEQAQMRAMRIARTEISDAFGAAKDRAMDDAVEKVPGIKRMWVKVGSYPCKVCDPLHGTTRDAQGTWTITQSGKTRKIAHPPAHPNCACTITVIKPGWKDGLEKLGYLTE